MSYLNRLSQLKSSLDQENANYQSAQESFTRDANNMAQAALAKIQDYARNLEQSGAIGFGAIKAGSSVKALYNKWRNKKQEPKEEEEEPEEPTEEPTEEADLPTEEGELEQPSETAQTSQEGPPEELQEAEGEEMLGEGENVADVSHLPSEVELNNASTFGENSAATITNNPEGLQSTQTQDQILDADPETNMNMDDATNNLNGGADVGAETAEATAETAAETAGTTAAESSLISADAVLDAVPVVGELAMIGTAIAGFFEGVYHDKAPKVPPPAIVSHVGADADALINKAPVSNLL